MLSSSNTNLSRSNSKIIKKSFNPNNCLSKRKRLESKCESQADLLKAKDVEIENLKAQMLLKEAEAAEAAHLYIQVSAVEATEKMHADEIDVLKQRNVDLENEKDSLDGKVKDGLVDQVAKLDADLLEMALHLEEKFYPHLLTTISSQRWLLTHSLKLAIVKCLNSQEYLSALGAAISRAIEKGMQDGLSAGIVHGKEGRSLADVAAYNPATEAEGPLADALGMSDSQPNVDQLMLLVHRSEDQVVLGETSLSFALSVTHSQVERIRDNVVAVPAIVATTTALSTTFTSASSIPPITIEDYEVVGTDGPEDAQGNSQGNVVSFPTVEFEKEELDTTPERDPPS
ncbi:hypothetical protein Tco_1455725 [Tanacetum coccineum]